MTLTNEEKIKFKQQIKEACINLLLQRIETASQAMLLAQESANESEKSSAGDKYETSRAMGQLERDMNAKQLEEAKRELVLLQSIDVTKIYEHVRNGAFVICGPLSFFVATGLGTVMLDNKKIVVLSPNAPLALQMIGKKKGNSFSMNATIFQITDIF